jgi:hypothetical protein
MKKIFKMKMYRLIVVLLSGVFLLNSCGKPTIPENVTKEDISGGYKIVNRVVTAGFAQDVVIKDHLAYIAQGEVGLMIINISDPLNPETVSITSENVRGYSSKIAMKDSVVYIAAGSFGVTVLNVVDPVNPLVTASNLSIKPAKNLYVLGDYLFAPISEQGLKVSDISYPTQPDIRGNTKTSGYAHDVVVTADTNFMLVACGEMGLSIFDISNFQNGFGEYPLISIAITPGYAESVEVLNEKSLAFMACGTAGLQIIDFSDTTNVHIVGSYDGGGYAKDLLFKNNRVYMTTEEKGLQIIDVSDATNPRFAGMIDTEYALGLDIDDQYVYVADEDEGLIIISIPD